MTERFSEILEHIRNEIDLPFCNHKKIVLPFDSINVEGIGKISIPISLNKIEKLKDVASQAPFGRGFSTLIDPEVRDALQIDGEKVLLAENVFSETIEDLLGEMNIDVGAIGVEGKLYKLLVYKEGGHFVRHRDTEKEQGMFATMIVQLPVEEGYEGGSLVVSHDGEEELVVFEENSDKQAYAVAFYADCEHELKEVKRGYRVALAVNLGWKKIPKQPYKMMMKENSLPYVISTLSEMEGYLKSWNQSLVTAGETTVETMPFAYTYIRKSRSKKEGLFHAIPLAYQYTKQNLSFTGLKGEDSELARFFLNLEGLEVFLVLQCKLEIGSPSYHYDPYSYRKGYNHRKRSYYDEFGNSDEDEDKDSDDDAEDQSNKYTMDELIDTEYSTDLWMDRYEKVLPIPFDLNMSRDLVGVDVDALFEDDEPAEQNYEDYTGNAGPTLENWYHKALLVITPKTFFFKHLHARDLSAALQFINSAVHGIDDQLLSKKEEEEEEGLLRSKEKLKKWLIYIFEHSEDLTKYSRTLLDLCQCLHYHEGLTTLFKKIQTLPDKNVVSAVVLMLSHVEKEEWLKHVKSVVFEANKDTSPTLLTSLTLQLIERDDSVTEAEILGRMLVSFVLPQKVWLNWSTDDLLNLLKILLFLQDQSAFILFATQLINEGNSLSEEAPLHRLLASTELWTIFENVAKDKGKSPQDENDHCGIDWLKRVVKARVRKVNLAAFPSMDTWSFPEAILAKYSSITQFLRSEKQSATFSEFNNMKHARNFANKYFGYGCSSWCGDGNGKYSATATAGGRGQGAYVTIVKNKTYFERQKHYLLNLKNFAKTLEPKLKNLGLDSLDHCDSSSKLSTKMLMDENESKEQEVIDLTDF